MANVADPSELRQASCVAIAGRAVMIEGPSASGKSSLALALIDRGAVLVGDDGVHLARQGRTIWASPPPNIAGKIELRGIGLIDLLATATAPLALILRIDPDPPRYIEQADTTDIFHIAIPTLAFFAGTPVDAIRAEYALRRHGLPADVSADGTGKG